MAIVHGRLAQVVKIMGKMITLQVFSGTGYLLMLKYFFRSSTTTKVSDELSGRF